MKYFLVLFITFVGVFSANAQELVLNGTLGEKAVVTINGSHRVLNIDEVSEGVTLRSVGSDRATFEVNNEIIELQIDKNFVAGKKAESQKAIVRIPTSYGGHYRVPGRINGLTVQFMVDTGATVVAMSLPEAKKLGVNYRAGEPITMRTANGAVKAYMVTLSRVSVGTLELNNVQAAVNMGDFPQEILLGNSYLSRVGMRRENGVLVLEEKY